MQALAYYEDRNPMVYSLEARHLFGYHRIINFLVNLPADFKLNNGWTKCILRRTIDALRPEIRRRCDKQRFVTPKTTG
jgi:asparagine synthase (glutamine-hydrolysing)